MRPSSFHFWSTRVSKFPLHLLFFSPAEAIAWLICIWPASLSNTLRSTQRTQMTRKKWHGTTCKHPVVAIFRLVTQLCCEFKRWNHDFSAAHPDLKGRILVEEIVCTVVLRLRELQFGSELNQKLSRDVGNLREGEYCNDMPEEQAADE